MNEELMTDNVLSQLTEEQYEQLTDDEKDALVMSAMGDTTVVNAPMLPDYSLFPCVRLSDGMNFYCVYVLKANKWFVFDKISLMLVDHTATDSFRFVFSTSDNGPEDVVRYECNDTDDLWDTPDTQEITAELKKRIRDFNETAWHDMMALDLGGDVYHKDVEATAPVDVESVQNYRYENFVLNKFKKRYLGRVIRIETAQRVRFVKVVDFNVEYKKNTLARLNVSGQTIDIDSGERYLKCRFSDYSVAEKAHIVHFVGYLDELMLLQRNKKPFLKFDVLTDDEVASLFDNVKVRIVERYEQFMKELEEKRELFRDNED